MNAEFAIGGKTLETGRLLLRPFRQTDLEDFYAYASVEGVGEMAGWQHHESKEKTQEILDSFIREDKVFALVDKSTGKVIGSLGVEKYEMEDNLTEFDGLLGREIGFVLSRGYWGRGLMPEAVKVVTDFLFKHCNLDFCCAVTSTSTFSPNVFRKNAVSNLIERLLWIQAWGRSKPARSTFCSIRKKTLNSIFLTPKR